MNNKTQHQQRYIQTNSKSRRTRT